MSQKIVHLCRNSNETEFKILSPYMMRQHNIPQPINNEIKNFVKTRCEEYNNLNYAIARVFISRYPPSYTKKKLLQLLVDPDYLNTYN